MFPLSVALSISLSLSLEDFLSPSLSFLSLFCTSAGRLKPADCQTSSRGLILGHGFSPWVRTICMDVQHQFRAKSLELVELILFEEPPGEWKSKGTNSNWEQVPKTIKYNSITIISL